MFNALAGIQNLMNKNEVDQANRYLAKFARVTRSVLNNHETISVADERAFLDDYLQMEQLRFGFSYQTQMSDDPGIANLEIPTMLLQPFVENAVKYGIAALGTDGRIEIVISAQGKNLLLSVADNGSGFDLEEKTEGLGLKLSRQKIEILNLVYKDSPITLNIMSGASGTTVKIELQDWI